MSDGITDARRAAEAYDAASPLMKAWIAAKPLADLRAAIRDAEEARDLWLEEAKANGDTAVVARNGVISLDPDGTTMRFTPSRDAARWFRPEVR